MLFAKSSYVSKTQTLPTKGYQLNLNVEHFRSIMHSDNDGEKVSFEEGESYQKSDINFLGSYGLGPSLEMTVGLRGRHNVSTEMINNEQITFTQSGLESALLQIKYSFPIQDGFQYGLEANYRQTLYTNETFDSTKPRTKIVLGDASKEVSIGLGMSWYSPSQNVLTGKFLFRNPGAHLSSELYSEIEGAIVWPAFTMLAGVENIYSFNQDPYASDSSEKPQISAGSTYEFNSINRSWVAPYLGFNFGIGQTGRIEIKAKNKISGLSTDLGNEFMISFIKRNDRPTGVFAKKDAAFKEYKYEGVVTKLTKGRGSVVVNMGLEKGIKKGDKVDFYHFDYLGGNQLIATGIAIKVGVAKAIVKISRRYSKIRLEEGTIARSGLIQ